MALAALKTDAYSNWLMVGPDGVEMCRCAEKRAKWYLDRELAEVVSQDPPTIQLKFKPKANGNQGDEFSLAPKQNVCVVCGTEEDLTKHHIVPSMYRKHFPVKAKERSAHDVVVICIPCHEEYEAEATKLKKDIGIEYDARDNVAPLTQERRDLYHLVKLCKTLHRNSDLIPSDRQEEIRAQIASLFGKIPTTQEFENLVNSEVGITRNDPGKPVVEKVLSSGDLENFVKRWRQHFLDVAQPRFMPEYWSIERELVKP
jgi:hypothetical protein